jgi:hypothetical protein
MKQTKQTKQFTSGGLELVFPIGLLYSPDIKMIMIINEKDPY